MPLFPRQRWGPATGRRGFQKLKKARDKFCPGPPAGASPAHTAEMHVRTAPSGRPPAGNWGALPGCSRASCPAGLTPPPRPPLRTAPSAVVDVAEADAGDPGGPSARGAGSDGSPGPQRDCG